MLFIRLLPVVKVLLNYLNQTNYLKKKKNLFDRLNIQKYLKILNIWYDQWYCLDGNDWVLGYNSSCLLSHFSLL